MSKDLRVRVPPRSLMKYLFITSLFFVFILTFGILTVFGEQPAQGYERLWNSANLIISIIPVIVLLAIRGIDSLKK